MIKNRIRKAIHALDSRQHLIQPLALAIEFDALFLGQLLVTAISLHRFKIFQPLD